MGVYPYNDSKETKYVLGFYFSKGCKQVVLIEKLKPAWQKGKLNGVGGKFEQTDSSELAAMVREFREETGVETDPDEWDHYATYQGRDWSMAIFCASGDVSQVKTMEAEKVVTVDVGNLPSTVMRNLRFLIPLALQDDLGHVNFQEDDVCLSQGWLEHFSEDEKKNIIDTHSAHIEKRREARRKTRGLA